MNSRRIYRAEYNGSEDSSSEDSNLTPSPMTDHEDTYIGSSAWRFRRTFDSPPSVPPSAPFTPNLLAQSRLSNMYGRTTLPSSVPGSNSENDSSDETTSETGSRYGTLRSLETSWTSTPPYEYNTTELSNRLHPTTCHHWKWNGLSSSSGALRGPESQDELGLKQVWMPTQKTPEQNSGADTADKIVSSSMNFGAALTSLTCSAGSTATQSQSKPRVQPQYLGPVGSGSRPTYHQNNGSRDLTQRLWRRFCDVSPSRNSQGR